MIIPVYQPFGSSSHLLAQKVGKSVGEKATHTGTLDPMAEGVLVVLTGEDRFQKAEYTQWQKTYQFQVLVGVSTDSHDLLGKITDISPEFQKKERNREDHQKRVEAVVTALPSFVGKSMQVTPAFSAQRVAGKSGFDLAKKGESFSQRKNSIEIFSLELKSQMLILGNSLFPLIEEKIQMIQGDFRQQEILKSWKKFFRQYENIHFLILDFEATTSKRTYIRGIVRDLSEKLRLPLTTYSILRTQNGEFTARSCKRE